MAVRKRFQKSVSKKPAERSWKDSELKIIGWCMRKNIHVSITPDWKDDLNRWQIELNINGKIHIDPNRYNNDTVYNKVNEYYKYYYDKYNKQ